MIFYKLVSFIKRFFDFLISKSIKTNQIGDKFRIAYNSKINGIENIKIGYNFRAGSFFRLDAINVYNKIKYNPIVIIGNNVTINPFSHIACVNKIIIGNNVLIASKVLITDHSHGNTKIQDLKISPSKRNLISKGPVIIEDNVWIGENVVIMSGVKIGVGAIIGANSLVLSDIPSFSIVGGIPARIIK